MNSLNSPSSVVENATTMQPPDNLDAATLEPVDAASLRALGKELFSKGDYHGALKAYERWLELEPESSMAHSNKSAAHMVLKQWESTYLSARRAQELDSSNSKAAYRRGVALMRMRCYSGAVRILEAATAGDPSEESIARALKEAKLLAKQATGQFEPEDLYSGEMNTTIADYVGPVEVFETATMGRGLRVTREVQPGELLFVENSLAFFREDRPADYRDMAIMTENTRRKLLQQLSDRCLNARLDRRRMDAFFAKDVPLPSIQNYSPFSSEEELFAALKEEVEKKSIAPPRQEQLSKLFQANAVSQNRPGIAPLGGDAVFRKSFTIQSSKCSSIWLLGSLLNHSCRPNVTKVMIEGLCIVRASRRLSQGQELFMEYIDVHEPLQKRQKSLQEYNVHCTCQRCMFEEKLPENIKEQMMHINHLTNMDPPGPLHGLLVQPDWHKKLWKHLFPLLCTLERDLEAVGASDEQLDCCCAALSHPFRMLHAASILTAPVQT